MSYYQKLADRIEQTEAYTCADLFCAKMHQCDEPPGSGRSDVRVILVNEAHRAVIAKALRQFVP